MRSTSLVLAFIAALLYAPPSPAAVADPDAMADVRVTLRTYDTTALPPSDRLTAIAAATDILRAAGLDVEWLACDVVFVRSSGDPCLAPLGRGELAIRFVRLPPPTGHERVLSLGYSLVDPRTRSGSLATVYVDRVAGLATNCGIELGTLLGRAVAHEVGHLLLGTGEHAQSGLMRALWSREAIRNGGAATWQFTAREARAMRDAVRTRAAERLAFHIAE